MSNAVAVNLSTNMAENNKGSSPNDMEHSNLDTSLTEEDVYEVEEIVGVRKIGSQIQYRVRWSGYGSQHDTWEPKENLLTCEDLIDNYMNDKKNKPSSVKRKKNAGSWVMLQVQDSEQADSETFLRDPFWKNLEAGRINVFDGGDMYSKVKGRAARPESYNENALLKRRLSGIYDPQSDSSSKISTRSAKFSPCSSKSDHFKFTDGKFQSGSSVDEQSPQMTSRNVKSKPDNKKTPVKRNRKKKTNSMGQSRKRGKKRKNKPDLLLNAENVTADNDPIALVDITSDNNKRNDESESEAGELNDGSATVSSENKESVEKELSNDEIMPLNCEPGKSGLVSDLVSHADVKVESKFADKSSKLMIDTSTDDNSYSAIVKTESNVTSDVENSTDAMTKSEAIPASEIDKEEGDDVAQVVDAETIDCVQSEEASIKYFSEDELLLVDSYGASSGDEKNSEISEQLVEDSDSNRKSTGDIKDEDEDDDDEMSAFTSSMKYISMEPSKTKFGEKKSNKKENILSENKIQFDFDDYNPDEWLNKDYTEQIETLNLSNVEFREAVQAGDYDRVKKALGSPMQTYDLEQPDPSGTTLLMAASLSGYDEIVEMLVLNGADVNARHKSGNTALMLAADKCNLCTVAVLCQLGSHMDLQQYTGETALMKACKRGHIEVARYLLEHGVNFASVNRENLTALKLAKNFNHNNVQEVLSSHIAKVTSMFETQVQVTLNNTATIQQALFPLQCFSLCEGPNFNITFNHHLQPLESGVGMLLFIAHARINPIEMKCRFYGPCAVTAAYLNQVKLTPLTEEANFVLSFCPLQHSRNDLAITCVPAATSKAKLLVCAYKARLTNGHQSTRFS